MSDSENAEMQTGTVKFFNASKGYGFIQPENGPDVFVHVSALQRAGLPALSEGDVVQFNTAVDQRSGKPAVDVITLNA